MFPSHDSGSSSTESSKITTSLPYISYTNLARWLWKMASHLRDAVSSYISNHSEAGSRSAKGFLDFCASSSAYADVFVCDGYRLCRAAKLLMALGYGNFVSVIQYDTYAMAEAYIAAGNKWDVSKFASSDYCLDFSKFESAQIYNSPNLSLFPLLAYHKICNDHYRNEKWQPFEPWTCNIDYLLPTSNMNAYSFISVDSFTTLMTSILDLENSNLPIDYFTSVLPRAQYGDESAVSVGLDKADSLFRINDAADNTKGAIFGGSSYTSADSLQKDNSAPNIYNSPNLSILPLLAYHKICNDHYRNEKWQPFEPWTCNIDYLRPNDSMNAATFIDINTFTVLMSSIIDLENSNLPIDYFTSVLPRAQYGDESVAVVS